MHAGLPEIAPEKRIAALFLLPDCDMRCRFCATEDELDVMTYEQASGLLRALNDVTGGAVGNVVLGGGEPFLWPHDLVRLARFAKDLGYLVQVGSHGATLPDGFERIDCIDRFILPLESTDPAVHDWLRTHRDGHHATVIRRIEHLVRAGREFTISTVVNRANVDRLGDLADYLSALHRAGARLHAWHLYRMLPIGRGGHANADALTVERDAYRAACAAVRSRELGFTVYRRENMMESRSVEFFWYREGKLHTASGLRSSQRA